MVEVLFGVVATGGKAEQSSDTTYLVHRIKALTNRFRTKHILLFSISKEPRFIFLQRCGQSRNSLTNLPWRHDARLEPSSSCDETGRRSCNGLLSINTRQPERTRRRDRSFSINTSDVLWTKSITNPGKKFVEIKRRTRFCGNWL